MPLTLTVTSWRSLESTTTNLSSVIKSLPNSYMLCLERLKLNLLESQYSSYMYSEYKGLHISEVVQKELALLEGV